MIGRWKMLNDLLDEIKRLFKADTIDAILPPFVYVVENRIVELPYAVTASIFSAIIIGFMRVRLKGSLKYLGFGILGVVFAYEGHYKQFY